MTMSYNFSNLGIMQIVTKVRVMLGLIASL